MDAPIARDRTEAELRAVMPKRSPMILKLGNHHITWLGLILGVSGGFGVVYYLNSALKPTNMLRQIHDFQDWHSVIPISIICMFGWGLVICFFRWMRLTALKSVSSNRIGTATSALLTKAKEPTILKRALDASPAAKTSPFLRRACAILEQWLTKPGLPEANLVLANQQDVDAEATHAGYSLVRTFIWALPVIGLVGTVLGISNAVGGFATFLGGDVEEVSEIKGNLAAVTSGLSFAFSITLEGLATSLILMLIASVLQTSEEGVYYRAQGQIYDHLLPALQIAAPVRVDGRDELYLREIERLRELVDRQTAAVEGMIDQIDIGSRRILLVIEALRDSFPELVSAMNNVSERLIDQQPVIKDVAEANSRTAELLPEVLSAQESLNLSIEKLDGMGLEDTLTALAKSLNNLAPVLDKLSRPFEFKVGLGGSE